MTFAWLMHPPAPPMTFTGLEALLIIGAICLLVLVVAVLLDRGK